MSIPEFVQKQSTNLGSISALVFFIGALIGERQLSIAVPIALAIGGIVYNLASFALRWKFDQPTLAQARGNDDSEELPAPTVTSFMGG